MHIFSKTFLRKVCILSLKFKNAHFNLQTNVFWLVICILLLKWWNSKQAKRGESVKRLAFSSYIFASKTLKSCHDGEEQRIYEEVTLKVINETDLATSCTLEWIQAITHVNVFWWAKRAKLKFKCNLWRFKIIYIEIGRLSKFRIFKLHPISQCLRPNIK